MKEIIVNGHKWYFSKELPKVELWYSNWHCSDGDGVSMYVDKINKNLELFSFSGIGCSSIIIDAIDFSVFSHNPNIVEGLDHREPFENQCCNIADYLCSKFCEYKIPDFNL